MVNLLRLENATDSQGRRSEQVARSKAECQKRNNVHDDCLNKTKIDPSLPEVLNAERRLLEGIRLPAGHRYFPDRERETWARFIDWSMNLGNSKSWFGTYTFKYYLSEYKANMMIDRHLARMTEALKHSGGSRLRYFVATEWQKRDVIHFHSLLTANGLEILSRKRWEKRWEHMGGGFARLYDADPGAAPYLAKYMNKSRGGELRLGGAWQGINPPGAVDPGTVMPWF